MSQVFWKISLTLLVIIQITQAWELRCYVGSLDNYKSVTYKNAAELITSGYFNVTKKSLVYAHGYRGTVTTQGTNEILEAHLTHKTYDMNVCAIDYAEEANEGLIPFANFPIVVLKAYQVQREVAQALKILWQNGMKPEDMHMMGLSLGAHVCGNAARTFYNLTNKKFARVTGLDPAKPSYDGKYTIVPRIDHTCAVFVDIIHTDINRYGMATPTGHLDLFANIVDYKKNGVQPGCDSENPFVNPPLTPKDACSHRRALNLYLDSLIYYCQLVAAKAASEDEWASADFVPRDISCVGENVNQTLRGVCYFRTEGQYPYGKGQAGLTAQ